jgi:hypothetical protein
LVNSCLDSMVGRQGKLTPDGSIVTDAQLIETCDDSGVCLYFPSGSTNQEQD